MLVYFAGPWNHQAGSISQEEYDFEPFPKIQLDGHEDVFYAGPFMHGEGSCLTLAARNRYDQLAKADVVAVRLPGGESEAGVAIGLGKQLVIDVAEEYKSEHWFLIRLAVDRARNLSRSLAVVRDYLIHSPGMEAEYRGYFGI